MPEKNTSTRRRRVRQPSGGLVAIGAVLLAASSTTLSASSSAAPGPDVPVPPEPVAAAEPGADGGTVPNATFPVVETHLASSVFVHAVPASASGRIPATVLAAYRRGAERTNLGRPDCHLPFELLAAIGKVESGHARGGQVDATGRTLTPILGPVLNGGPFAAIRDTDSGAFDRDTSWDRAVGPMQFIPGTWAQWQADGNDDGTPDPHNVYDASLAAARYLCAANRDLGTPDGLDAAVLSYNHSTSYLSLVRSWLSVYRNGTVTVTDITDLTDVGWTPPVPTAPTPSTPATPPSSPPPSSPPPSSPPPSSPPPSTPPPSTPPPTTPPTPPTTPPPTSPTEPPAETPAEEAPAEQQCGLLDTVGGLVGGLLGESPDCVLPLELSTP